MPVLILGTTTDPIVTENDVSMSCAKLGGWDSDENEYNRQGFGVADGLEFVMHDMSKPTHLPMACSAWDEEGGMRESIVDFLDRKFCAANITEKQRGGI